MIYDSPVTAVCFPTPVPILNCRNIATDRYRQTRSPRVSPVSDHRAANEHLLLTKRYVGDRVIQWLNLYTHASCTVCSFSVPNNNKQLSIYQYPCAGLCSTQIFWADSTSTHVTTQVIQLWLNATRYFSWLTQLRLNSNSKLANLTQLRLNPFEWDLSQFWLTTHHILSNLAKSCWTGGGSNVAVGSFFPCNAIFLYIINLVRMFAWADSRDQSLH